MQNPLSTLTTGQRIRKALCVQVGEDAGNELVDLIDALIDRVEHLERGKVDVMPIVPTGKTIVKQRSKSLNNSNV
ncbi:MAG TPA: hypothetical protein P5307_03485 [Pirellulaceae bacterium]|nr:hypothetical protein [Planctomycetales bacterium]MCB9940326.1 hypothetical protein [Planctomycetaceae bacterium]HRX78094.1 hypothetical protein [Pirellulaceae bacterium]